MIRSSTTISDLDLGSFQRILSYLRYVDKLKLLLATKCIAKLAEEIIDNEPFDVFNVQMNFSLQEIKQLLTDYGQYVKRIRYVESFSDETILAYLKLLPEYCTNLQEIYLSGLEITTTNVSGQILSSAQKTIEKLALENCTVRKPECLLIASLSQLKVLNLQSSKLSGKYFGRLKNLTDLNLRKCKNFHSGNFIDILKSNKLVKLNLEGFKQLPGNIHDILLKTQPNLKVLTVGNSFWSKKYPQICRMKTLREISMSRCYEESVVKYLTELVDNGVPIESLEINVPLDFPEMADTIESAIVDRIIQLDNLRVLSFRNSGLLENSHLVKIAKSCRNIEMLDLYGSRFSDLGIIGCIEYLKHLRHLDVSYCNVKKSLYSRLVEIRKELGFVQKLVVYIRPQMELEAVLKSDEYADTMALIQLTLRQMRSVSDSSVLERLQQLNLMYYSDDSKLNRKVWTSTKLRSPQEPSLLVLDDNCLYLIVQYLTLVDQLTLALTNTRFANVVKFFLYTKTFKLDEFVANFTVREARKLFPRFGHLAKKLHAIRPKLHVDTEYYDLVAKYFTNVVELDCDLVELCKKIVTNSRNTLEVIDIRFCEIDDGVSLEISKAAKLHTLILADSTLTGAHFGNLTNITSLDLSDVNDLEPASFIAICKSNRLKNLNIMGCKNLDNHSLEVLVETQITLEVLAIGDPCAATNMYHVAGLKNLKDLKVYQSSREQLLRSTDALAELKCDQLQFLDVMCQYEPQATISLKFAENIAALQNLIYLRISQSSAIDTGFIKVLAIGCPLLKALNVSHANNLNCEGIFEAIRLFKHLRHFDVNYCDFNSVIPLYRGALEIKMKGDGRVPLVLHASTSREHNSDIVNTRDYIINKKYLELSFDYLTKPNKDETMKEKAPQSQCKTELKQSNKEEIDSLKPNILDIPGICLQRIASYLQPIDKLVFAYLHKTILISIETALDDLLHSLNDIARIFTVSEARDLFAACAGHIKRIQISTNDRTGLIDYINLLQPYCSHLTEMDITWRGYRIWDEAMHLFGTGDQKLQKLSLNECQSVDEILEHLGNTSSELSVLNVSYSYLTGQYIDGLKHITDLNLMDCSSIEDEYFQSICRSCKLKRLNITGVRFLTESSFKVLVETQSDHLEQLFMSCRYDNNNYTEVAKLENLRHIAIEIDALLLEFQNFLKTLVRYRRDNLESLEIKVTAFGHRLGMYIRTHSYTCMFDMIEEVTSNFRNLKDIVVKMFPEF